MSDGTTIVNPSTGERMMLRGGQWTPMGGGSQGTVPTAPSTVIPPNPLRVAERERERARQDATDARADRGEIRSEERFQEQLRRDDERDRRAAGTTARAEVAAGRLPGDKEKALREAVSTVSNLGRANTTFKDDYLGFGSGLENTAQSYLNIGTPGQRDWWADFRSTDNLVRNELFGASLTAAEKSSYAATSITPDMAPDQARKNIARRNEIARTGLGRYRKYLLASGYGQEAVDALMGDAMSAPAAPPLDQPAEQRPDDDASDVRPRAQSFTIDNVSDFMTGLSGGKYVMERDGLFYTPPGGRLEPVDLADEIANSDEYRNAYRAKFGEEPILQVSVEGGTTDPSSLPVARGAGGFVEKTDAFVRGAADTVSLGTADEISAAGRTIFGGGTMRDNLRGERAVDEYDAENNFGSRLAGQFAGGFALPMGRAGGGSPAASDLAMLGAKYSAGYGFGSAEGSGLDRLQAAGSGALIGAGLGYGVGRLGQAVAGRTGGGGAPGAQQLMMAARRQGVDPLPADVGGPFTRRMTSAAAQAPVSAGPIIRGGQRVNEQVGTARDRIAASVGSAGDPYAAGEAAQSGAASYISSSREQVGEMYDLARRQAGGVRPVAQRAINTLDANLAELAETPSTSAPVTAALERLGADLTEPDGLSIDALRRLRTNVRGLANTDELRGTDFERRAGQVLDAISEDIAAGLPPSARGSFRAADQAHRERVETIDQVLRPIVGGRGDKAFAPEKVFQNIMSASRSDSGRLRRFVQALPDPEAADLAASVIGQLGRASAGAQGAEGATFSTTQFLTHWNQMSTRAKASLFQGETRSALDDLARIAEGSNQAASYANRSNTGGAVGGNVAGLLGIGYLASPTAAIGSAAAQYVTGRLLASPRFARWLARPARTPTERSAAIRRLGAIVTREPALRAELLPLQRLLTQSVEASRPALAADERERGRQQR